MTSPAFEVVGEDVESHPQPESQSDANAALLSQIIASMLSLEALSKKAAIAVSNLFTLIALLCVGGLWYYLLDAPTTQKLVGGGIFSLFVLSIEWIRRK